MVETGDSGGSTPQQKISESTGGTHIPAEEEKEDVETENPATFERIQAKLTELGIVFKLTTVSRPTIII